MSESPVIETYKYQPRRRGKPPNFQNAQRKQSPCRTQARSITIHKNSNVSVTNLSCLHASDEHHNEPSGLAVASHYINYHYTSIPHSIANISASQHLNQHFKPDAAAAGVRRRARTPMKVNHVCTPQLTTAATQLHNIPSSPQSTSLTTRRRHRLA